MKVHIAIDTKTFVRFWVVVIAFALVALAIYQARTALIIVGTAFFFAMVLNVPVSMIARYLPRGSRVLSTAIAYIAVLLILGLVIFLVIPPIIEQSVKLADTLPSLTQSVTSQWAGVDHLITKYHVQGQVDTALTTMKVNLSHWATGLVPSLVASLGSAANFAASSVLVLVLTFLMLVEGPDWLERLWGIYRDEERMEHHRSLMHKMYGVVTGYITGQLTVSALDGAFAGFTVFILSFFLHVPANLALPTAAIMFLTSLIPMFGAIIGGVLVAILLLLNDPTAAIIFVVYFIIYQQIEANFISPTIQSRKLELAPLAILVAVTIGLYVFGIVGGIISIPIAGCIKVLIEDYLASAHRARKHSEKPLAKLAKKLRVDIDS